MEVHKIQEWMETSVITPSFKLNKPRLRTPRKNEGVNYRLTKNEDKFDKNHLSNRNTLRRKSTVVWQQQLSKQHLTPNHEAYSQLDENPLTVHSEIITLTTD